MLTVQDSIKDLENKGYKIHYRITEGKLYSEDNKISLEPSSMQVEEIYRIDEDSAADGQSVIYALSSLDDIDKKGVLVSAYGRFADVKDMSVLKQFDDQHQANKM